MRVFPRQTNATPRDELAAINRIPTMFDEADKVHISVTFTWDIPRAEWLMKQWSEVAPTEIGGPAIGTRGEEFIPGRYLKDGYTITSRGCPNKCWFCEVWRREGNIRELQIKDGWNILDDNLFACSSDHIRGVFTMLGRQGVYPRFSGGLEAARLEPWHADLLKASKAKWIFFAYDTPDDLEPLKRANEILMSARILTSKLYCYVLCGYPGDTFSEATKRMHETYRAGFMPFAMLYRDYEGKYNLNWRRFQRQFARPTIARNVLKGTVYNTAAVKRWP